MGRAELARGIWRATGWTLSQKYIFDEEHALAAAPRLVSFGLNMCGPILMGVGTAAQKQGFLPRML